MGNKVELGAPVGAGDPEVKWRAVKTGPRLLTLKEAEALGWEIFHSEDSGRWAAVHNDETIGAYDTEELASKISAVEHRRNLVKG